VPATGAAATYTSDGAVLLNKFRDVVVGDPFYPSKIRNAYSGTFLHSSWGTFGGMLLYGGGHANTNHNGVYIIEYGLNTLQFKRLIDATTWVAGDPGDISAEFNSYGEVIGSSPLQITSGHSYGGAVVIDGYLTRVIRQAFMTAGGGNTEAQAYHTLDLTNTATASSARAWVRRTNTLGSWTLTDTPSFIAHAESQGRLYYMSRGNAPTPRWFDLNTKAWMTGGGAGWGCASADTDVGDPVTGTMFPVPERDLIVGAWRQSGVLRIQYLDTTNSDPSVATATLSTSLALPVEGGKAVCWCSRNNRILVFGVTGNTDRCYEITIPTTLTDPWTVDSAAITGVTIDPVAIMTRAGWGCQYHDATRSVLFVHDLKNSSSSPDTIDRTTVYRPRNT
jgi:hypothetical protein